jgi:hypothetical protein
MPKHTCLVLIGVPLPANQVVGVPDGMGGMKQLQHYNLGDSFGAPPPPGNSVTHRIPLQHCIACHSSGSILLDATSAALSIATPRVLSAQRV